MESGKVTVGKLSNETKGDAVAGDILDGKTAWVNGQEVTGSMTDYSSKTVDADKVENDGTYTTLMIPNSGYYNQNSKLKILNTKLQNKEYTVIEGVVEVQEGDIGFACDFNKLGLAYDSVIDGVEIGNCSVSNDKFNVIAWRDDKITGGSMTLAVFEFLKPATVGGSFIVFRESL